MAEIEALSSKMLDTVTADLQEEQGRLTDPFENLEAAVQRGEVVVEAGRPCRPMTPEARKMYETAGLLRPVPEQTRSAMDEMPSHDALHDHMPEGS